MKVTTLLAAAIAAFPAFSFGQTTISISQTRTFSGIPDFTAPLLFNKYSGNASDITNVSIRYSFHIEGGQFVLDNDAASPANVTASFGGSLSAQSPDVRILDSSFNPIISGSELTNSGTFSLAANTGDGLNDYDSSGPDGAVLPGLSRSRTVSDRSVNSLFFGDYAGTGGYTINAVVSQFGRLSFNSGIETATTPVSSRGSITVTYTVVPEPSSFALLGLGALGFALRRRRA